jgi:hypothetical protein
MDLTVTQMSYMRTLNLSSAKRSNDEYENAPWNPEAQLQAQLNTTRLAQLHAEIKARAQLPDPTYKKLLWSWPPWPFDIRILPDYV